MRLPDSVALGEGDDFVGLLHCSAEHSPRPLSIPLSRSCSSCTQPDSELAPASQLPPSALASFASARDLDDRTLVAVVSSRTLAWLGSQGHGCKVFFADREEPVPARYDASLLVQGKPRPRDAIALSSNEPSNEPAPSSPLPSSPLPSSPLPSSPLPSSSSSSQLLNNSWSDVLGADLPLSLLELERKGAPFDFEADMKDLPPRVRRTYYPPPNRPDAKFPYYGSKPTKFPPPKPRELDALGSLIELGHRVRSRSAAHGFVYDTVVYIGINGLEALLPQAGADALKGPVAAFLSDTMNKGLEPMAFENVIAKVFQQLVESLVGDMVDQLQKQISEHVNPRLREELKYFATASVTRDVSRAVIVGLTREITVALAKSLPHILEHDLTRVVTRHVNAAVIPGVTLSTVPAVARSVKRVRMDDFDCHWCTSSDDADKRAFYCQRCYDNQMREATDDYFNYFYSRYHARYYAYYYGGYMADYEAHEYLAKYASRTMAGEGAA